MKAVRQAEIDKYSKLVHENGVGLGSLGYSSAETQRMRLRSVMNILRNHNIRRVLDVGCGQAALLDMMVVSGFYENKNEVVSSYMGVDIIQELVNQCKRKYPYISFECGDYELICKRLELEKWFDAVVSIGTHSAKSEDAYENFLYNARTMYKFSERIAILTVMTDNKFEIKEDEFVVSLPKVIEDLSKIEEKIIVDRSTCPYEAAIALVKRI